MSLAIDSSRRDRQRRTVLDRLLRNQIGRLTEPAVTETCPPERKALLTSLYEKVLLSLVDLEDVEGDLLASAYNEATKMSCDQRRHSTSLFQVFRSSLMTQLDPAIESFNKSYQEYEATDMHDHATMVGLQYDGEPDIEASYPQTVIELTFHENGDPKCDGCTERSKLVPEQKGQAVLYLTATLHHDGKEWKATWKPEYDA